MNKTFLFFTFLLVFVELSIGLCGGKSDWIETWGDNSLWINWTNYTLYSELNGTSNELDPDYINLKRQKIYLMNKLYNATLNLELKKGMQLRKILNKNGNKLLWELINASSNSYMIKTSPNSYRLIMGLKLLGPLIKQALPISLILKEPDVLFNNLKKQDYIKGYTGVVIEVSTNQFKPCLFIYIYSKKGELLFSPKVMDYDILINKGMALYLIELNNQVNDRVGSHPLFLHADSIYKENEHSLVLDENSDFYLKLDAVIQLLKKGRLVILKKRYSQFIQDEVNEFSIEN